MMLVSPIFKTIQRIYSPYSSTLLAFSGGVDSTVLFFLLLELQRVREDFSFEVFSLNHQMPRNEAHGNHAAVWAKEICEKYSVPCHLKTVHEGAYEESHLSLEELGRVFRYSGLHQTAYERKLQSISMGHHRDDLVETVLMRLFQGVSPDRLCAMREIKEDILRPLLSFSKTQLRTLAKESSWDYLEDPSNTDISYKRNYMREKILPEIRKYFPFSDEKVIQFLNLLEEQNQELKQFIPIWKVEKGRARIDREKLEQCSSLLRKESLKSTILKLDPSHYFTYRQLEFLSHYITKYSDSYQGEKILYYKKGLYLKKQQKEYVCEYEMEKNFV